MRHIKPALAPTSYVSRCRRMRAFARYVKKQKKEITALTQSDIEQYLLSRNGGTLYRQNLCYMLKDFFDFLKVPENPAGNIVFKPNKQKKLFKVPSQQSIQRVFAALSDEDDHLTLRNKLIVELAYGSGLRRTELTKVNIEDIDFAGKSARIQGKGSYDRIVPLTKSAIDTIRKYLDHRKLCQGPLLVSCVGKRLHPNSLYNILIKKAGIRPHLLRHACATHMLKNGCSIRVIQELLGHKSLKSTQVYTEVVKGDLKEIIEKNHPRKFQLFLCTVKMQL